MGLELELSVLLIIQLIATSLFAKFEIGTPGWKKILKWIILDIITLLLSTIIGHLSLLFPLLIIIIGIVVHFSICKKHGIGPIEATPHKKLYELRG